VLHLVSATIRPSRIDDVRDALEGMGITVTEVHGVSRQGGHTETYRGAEYQIELVPKVRVDLVVEAGDVDRLIDLVTEAARSGKLGDGKIWVTPIEQVVRVRTGEAGPAAL
jgi:nitrogen regulatory protein P-II 1